MRRINERVVFEALSAHAPISRAGLAARTGISKPTIGQAVSSLAAAGIAAPVGRSSGLPGRSGTLFGVDGARGCVVAVDVAVGAVRAAVADFSQRVLAEQHRIAHPIDLEALELAVVEIVEAVLRTAGMSCDDVLAAVVGSPGAVDPLQPGLTHVGRLTCLDGADLRCRLGERLGIEVLIENDVNLAAVGEQVAGHSDAHMAVLSIGGGIGAALILDGTLFRGPRGAAGEIESVPFDGRRSSSRVPTARRSLAEFTAVRVSALAAVTNVQLVVLRGEVMFDERLLADVRAMVAAQLETPPTIERSELGDRGVLVGALAQGAQAAVDRVFAELAA